MAAKSHLFQGVVFAKFGGKVFKKRRLLAICGGTDSQPAKLILLKCDAEAKIITEISFSKVQHVHHHLTEDKKHSVILTLDDDRQFSFYPESDSDFESWSVYCTELWRIPNYSIPQSPKIKKSMKLGKCSDKDTKGLNASCAWEVFIINAGAGRVFNCTGKHIITLCDEDRVKQKDASFNINNFYTKKCLHTWNKSELKPRPFGHLNSMVYIEVPRHGLLWMYCPGKMALELNETIHKFMFDVSAESVDYYDEITSSVDSGIGSCSPYHLTGLPNTTDTILSSSSTDHLTSSQLNNSPLLSSPVENSLLPQKYKHDSCHGNRDDYNHIHTSNQESLTHLNLTDHTTTVTGYTSKSPNKSLLPMMSTSNDLYKETSPALNHYSISRQYKRRDSSPHLAMKKQQIFFHSLPPNFTQEYERDGSMKLDDQWEKQREVLWKCSPLISQCLDITVILPYLMREDLVNDHDHDILRNELRPRNDKIHHLLHMLPRKPNLFEKLLRCLDHSSRGTAHAEIAEQLNSHLS